MVLLVLYVLSVSILLSIVIVHYTFHSSLDAAFKQIFFLLVSHVGLINKYLFVCLTTPTAIISLVESCWRGYLSDWSFLYSGSLIWIGTWAHDVLLASSVSNWGASPTSFGISNLGIVIFLTNCFELSLKWILMCFLI